MRHLCLMGLFQCSLKTSYTLRNKNVIRRNADAKKDFIDQAIKGAWRMPWHQESKKVVISCDKLGVDAHGLRTQDHRMRQLTGVTPSIRT